jgi:hypothetical protein
MLADGNGNDNNFVISRYFGAEKLSLAIWNVGGGPPACQGEVDINQGVWTTLIFRYSQSADKIDVLINGQYALNPKACEIPPADLTVNNAWVAKSNVEGDPYANLKLAGLVIVDGYMSDDDAVATGAALEGRHATSKQSGVISHHNYSNLDSCRWLIAVEGADCANAPVKLNFKKLKTKSTAYHNYAFSIKRTLNPDEQYAGISEIRFYDFKGHRLVPNLVSNPGGDNPATGKSVVKKKQS